MWLPTPLASLNLATPPRASVMSSVLRNLPSVSELLDSPPLKSLVHRVNRNVVVSGVRQFLDDMRTQVQSAAANVPSAGELAQKIADWIATAERPGLQPVINATGVLLPAGLGRAPLAEEALAAVAAVSRGYANVEIDLASGEHSPRTAAVESMLTKLTGAEAAIVVNSSAAATLLALAALAAGREVIVSRGQLIEVGGDYRLPDLIRASGAVLREVGTTNKTRVGDYAAAIGERTAAVLRVHASDSAIIGDTAATSLSELVALARPHSLPVIDGLGSGGLIDLSSYGVKGEPVASESIRAGADLVLLAGDKLLGGPQCGIIAGRRSLVQQLARHPLLAALEADKLTLAALAATLDLYRDPALAERSIPLLTLLATPLENLRHRAERLAPQIQATGVAAVEIIADHAYVGEGALPSQMLATICLALTPATGGVEALTASLRRGSPAVIGRIQDSRLLLDLRSVQPRDDASLAAAFAALAPKTELIAS